MNLNKKVVIISLILITLYYTLNSILSNQYNIYIYVLKDNLDSPIDRSSPHKKKWFNAKKWIESGQYIQADQEHIININGVKLKDVLREKLLSKIYLALEIKGELTLDSYSNFVNKITNLNYEYLYSSFDDKLDYPNIHHFYFYFTYKNMYFENEFIWNEKNDSIYVSGYKFKNNHKEYLKEYVGKSYLHSVKKM